MNAFTLEVGEHGLATLAFDLPGRTVNLFTDNAVREFADLLEILEKRDDLRGLIVHSTKEGSFCHGLDIGLLTAIEEPAQGEEGSVLGQTLMRRWETLPFPTFAAIDGICLGSGLELALACTDRLVSDRPEVRLGLPEVRLGIVPAWGACIRLPRLIGLAEAVDFILDGRHVPPPKALRLGLVAAVYPAEGFLDRVQDFALVHLEDSPPRHHGGDLKELLLERNPLGRKILFDRARKNIERRSGGHYPAPLRAIEVLRTITEKGRRAGFAATARAVGELASGSVCKNLLHNFRLTHEAKRHPLFEARPALPVEPRPVAIERAAVVGAGVMGRGIGYLLAEGGIPVQLKDHQVGVLSSAMAQIGRLAENRRGRRRLSGSEARHLVDRVRPCLDYAGFEAVQLVVEAVEEQLPRKRQVLAEVAERVPPTTILASNTSSLSIDALAEGLPHPERVLGLHFLNPAHRMPLVEIVAGRRTAPEVGAAAVELIHHLGKTPVAVRDAPGFLVNRLLTFYLSGALWLLNEGHRVADLDRILTDWGMPQGPFALMDRVGIDLAVEVGEHLMGVFGGRLAFPDWDWQGVLLDQGKLGEKSGAGFYRYQRGKRLDPDPEIPRQLDLPRSAHPMEPAVVVDRLLLPMVNEAARCLEEGVVATAADLDVAVLLGLGFPPFRGGLLRWADQRGLEAIVNALDAPSEALRQLAREGGFYGTGRSGPYLA